MMFLLLFSSVSISKGIEFTWTANMLVELGEKKKTKKTKTLKHELPCQGVVFYQVVSGR